MASKNRKIYIFILNETLQPMKIILGMIMDGRKAYYGGNIYVYVILFH